MPWYWQSYWQTPLAQRPRQVGHLREVARSALVDPTKELHRAKRLLAEPLAVSAQRVEVEVEQIDHTRSLHRGQSAPGRPKPTAPLWGAAIEGSIGANMSQRS